MSYKIINETSYKAMLKTRPPKGDMAWEYNAFKNLRLDEDKYVYKDTWYSKSDLEKVLTSEFGEGTLQLKDDKYIWKVGEKDNELSLTLHEKYELVDFDTTSLEFDLTHPVEILPLPSYDGSVNLVLNDGKHTPRLINSRFSVQDSHHYEIVDRKGDNDTNIYDEGELFDIDTSLYKRVNNILKIEFKGVSPGGNMRVGNYHFYFKLSDADGNESDFIGQSGLVSLFIGYSDPHSVYTGTKNLNCHKMVNFVITNIDKAYSYVTVYYSRTSTEGVEDIVSDCLKIDKKYLITEGKCKLQITGFEETIEITDDDLNQSYNIIDAAKTLALNGNRLFLGNVHKAEIPYKELSDLALRFLPYPCTESNNLNISESYNISSKYRGYYDVLNIYNKVGYWPEEYYRFGVVYILKSGELSPVFNIRGALGIKATTPEEIVDIYEEEKVYDENNNRNYIQYNEDNYLLKKGKASYENARGVISCNVDDSLNKILYIKIKLDEETLKEIRKYAKGFFFVRQKRIPTILAQGITIGIDSESRTPVIPTKGGILKLAIDSIGDNTHVSYEYEIDENSLAKKDAVNYITEGFLTRYIAKYNKKKEKGWKKMLKIAGAIAAVAAIAVVGVVTFGGGFVAAAVASSIYAATAATVAVATAAAAAAAAAALVVGTVAVSLSMAGKAIKAKRTKKVYNGWDNKVPSGFELGEEDNSRKVGGSFKDRLIIKKPDLVEVKGIICPEYSLNLPYFNSIFTGNSHVIKEVNSLPNLEYFLNNRTRHFYASDLLSDEDTHYYNAKIVGLRDNVKIVGIGDLMFRARAGEAEEAWQYEAVGNEYKVGDIDDGKGGKIDPKLLNSDIVRGIFGPYLASNTDLRACKLVNIYIPGYSESSRLEYMLIRVEDKSPFYLISDRIDIQIMTEDKYVNIVDNKGEWDIYRGDSYLCQYTLRIIRNFNDPAAPLNDVIVNDKTWKDNYTPGSMEKYEQINLGDVNAVELGIWVTFKLRSSYNLNIRSIDESWIDEKAMSGHGRGYYPVLPMSTAGSYKQAESAVYNKGFSVSVGQQVHFEEPDVPAIKNWFGTRIMYSDIHVTDAFRNGYRVFQPTNYRDYTREYGEITKLVSYGNDLVCVLEHGILLIPINSLAVHTTHLNTNNVLPLNPTVISSDFGSLWQDSVIKTDSGIYGLDTVAKKIWRFGSRGFELLSEGVVLEFLNRNIRLLENDTDVVLGRRNVKTLYNKFKYDVMFTFYNVDKVDEVAWNLCYNEKMGKFITFYSWIPSFMENIDNIPFSFDRETSRYLSILHLVDRTIQVCKKDKEEYIPYPLIKDDTYLYLKINDIYKEDNSTVIFTKGSADNGYKTDDLYIIRSDGAIFFNKEKINKFVEHNGDIIPLIIRANVTTTSKLSLVKSTTYELIVYVAPYDKYISWKTDFWKHGLAGIIDIANDIKPAHWYGNQHPFEFEFVVNDKIRLHKIFDDLEIISNNAEPESFHYEIVGDAYSFANDKKNMFIRQEATNRLYQYNGGNVVYDKNYIDLKEDRSGSLNYKSTILPLNYYRLDTRNTIHDWYLRLNPDDIGKDYSELAGGELKYYKGLNEYHIVNHAEAIKINDPEKGRLRGNMHYREDTWKVQINPLNIVLSNEPTWDNGLIPFELSFGKLPTEIRDLDSLDIFDEDNKKLHNRSYVFWNDYRRSEAKLKDKWIKIRVRYKGDKLAIISAIRTLYSISYS